MSNNASQPLSAVQAQLLAGQLLKPLAPLCNMALACRIEGVLDQHRMLKAWGEIAHNSEALGIRIEASDHLVSQRQIDGFFIATCIMLFVTQLLSLSCGESWPMRIHS